MTVEQTVHVAVEGPVATLTIDRESALNALNPTVVEQLEAAIDALSFPAVRAVILTGKGKAFVAGADIAAMTHMTPEQGGAFSELGHRTLRKLETAPFVVIAAVNGFALGGGCELALSCDFIYASEKAKFGQPEVKLGIIPGFGGTQRLTRRVGIGKARHLVLTGEMIRSDEALRIGLADAVYPPDELMAAAQKTALGIAEMGPLAVAAAKRVMLSGADVPLEAANQLEAEAFADLFQSQDQTEGMSAFLEKRKANFTAS